MTFARLDSGKRGEDLAQSFLKRQGYKIIAKNYKTRLGEIDIISEDKNCISFVEVRSGNTGRLGSPLYTINRRKQEQIAKSALLYIKRYGLQDRNCRFDVVCIEDVNTDSPNIRLIKDAFDLGSKYIY